jgi:hypothetical protein
MAAISADNSHRQNTVTRQTNSRTKPQLKLLKKPKARIDLSFDISVRAFCLTIRQLFYIFANLIIMDKRKAVGIGLFVVGLGLVIAFKEKPAGNISGIIFTIVGFILLIANGKARK